MNYRKFCAQRNRSVHAKPQGANSLRLSTSRCRNRKATLMPLREKRKCTHFFVIRLNRGVIGRSDDLVRPSKQTGKESTDAKVAVDKHPFNLPARQLVVRRNLSAGENCSEDGLASSCTMWCRASRRLTKTQLLCHRVLSVSRSASLPRLLHNRTLFWHRGHFRIPSASPSPPSLPRSTRELRRASTFYFPNSSKNALAAFAIMRERKKPVGAVESMCGSLPLGAVCSMCSSVVPLGGGYGYCC